MMKRNLILLIIGFAAGILVTNHWMVPRIVEAKQAADRSSFRGFVVNQMAFFSANPNRDSSIQSYEEAVYHHIDAILRGHTEDEVYYFGTRACVEAWKLTWSYCNEE